MQFVWGSCLFYKYCLVARPELSPRWWGIVVGTTYGGMRMRGGDSRQ